MKRTASRQMSAKDKAFERERIKLHSVIQKKNEEICKLIAEVNQYKIQAESWEKTTRVLEQYIGIPREELLAEIERNKKICNFLKPLTEVGKYFL